MQLFSRNKALVALSLGALTALGACGDDVTVPVAPAAPVTISITPPSATMNVGEALNFAVQIAGGSSTAAPTLATCTSSNTAVATAIVQSGACRVTAVAAGNATVTAAASTGQAAAAGITVSAPAAAISGLTVSPSAAQLAIGQSVTIVPTVARANGSVNVTYTYTSSAATVASVNATTGVVTAVAPGTATITVSAAGSGTGATTTTLTSAMTVTVSERVPGLTSLQVSPATVALAVGGTQAITPTVQGPRAANVTYSYGTSAPSIASVNPTTGVITAVAQGTAVVTVTAQSAESGQFAASSLTALVTVTVAPLPNVTVADILQGPMVSRRVDSTFSGVSAAVASSTTTSTGPNQGVLAGIDFLVNGQVDRSVDILNVRDQIQVDATLQPNGQRIARLETYLCFIGSGAPSATVCNDYNGVAAEPASIQEFAAGNVNPGTIRVRINTAEFRVNEATGVATVRHINGRYVMRTRLVGMNGEELHSAVDTRAILTLNNLDGFALALTRPANSLNDASSRTWWGGPTTSDIGRPSGRGTFRVYDVMYTPGRSISEVTATFGNCRGFAGDGTPVGVADNARPFDFSYGTAAEGTAAVHIGCTTTGAYDSGDAFRFEDFPMVVASLDNQANPGPRVIYGYNPASGADVFGPRPQWFRYANEQPVGQQTAMRVDYTAPALTLTVLGPTGQRWVNDSWAFNSTGAYTFADVNTGSGRLAASNASFSIRSFAGAASCFTGTDFVTVGGIAATIADVPASNATLNTNALREHACDLTENAFTARATETDRLGNRNTTTLTDDNKFGIDNTAPTYTYGAGLATADTNKLAFDGRIYQPARDAAVDYPRVLEAGNAQNRMFYGAYSDERAGFDINNHGTRTVRRLFRSVSPLLSNVAVSESWTRTMNFLAAGGNPVDPTDITRRIDSVFMYGNGDLLFTTQAAAVTAARNAVNPQPASGYYEYSLTLRDRAGNSRTITPVRAVLDATSPLITGVTLPAVFGAQGTDAAIRQAFKPTGTDDVEVLDYEFYLRYPQLEFTGDSSNGTMRFVSAATTTGASRMRFRRDSITDVHTPFGVFADGLLAAPFGPGAVLSDAASVMVTRDNFRGMLMPINSIRSLETVDSTDSPINWGTNGIRPWTNTFKPNRIGVYAFDVRSTANQAAFLWRGMSNRNPSLANAGEAAYVDSIFQTNVADGVRWITKDLDADASNGAQRIITWSIFGTTSSRVTTNTEVSRQPFTAVHYVQWVGRDTVNGATSQVDGVNGTTATADSSGQWVWIGTTRTATITDQGSTRIWSMPTPVTLTASSCYRAIGVDAQGDAIVTKPFGTGCGTPTIIVGDSAAVTYRAYGNGMGRMVTYAAAGAVLADSLLPTDLTGRYLTLRKSDNFKSVVVSSRDMTSAGTDLHVQIWADANNQIGSRPTGCTSIQRWNGTAYVADTNVYPTTAPLRCVVTVGGGGLFSRHITAIFERSGQ